MVKNQITILAVEPTDIVNLGVRHLQKQHDSNAYFVSASSFFVTMLDLRKGSVLRFYYNPQGYLIVGADPGPDDTLNHRNRVRSC